MPEIDYDKLSDEAKKEGINRFVVGGIILKDSKILILERPKDDFMGGIYELPSGKVEEGEGLKIALEREIKEETGLNIKSVDEYVGFFDYESKSGKKTRQFNFLISVEEPMDIKLTEHDNFTWSIKDELSSFKVTENVIKVLDFNWNR